jgi:hypothetical protein
MASGGIGFNFEAALSFAGAKMGAEAMLSSVRKPRCLGNVHTAVHFTAAIAVREEPPETLETLAFELDTLLEGRQF